MKISFADIELDCSLYELRKQGQLVHVEPKTFSLLVHLAQNPDVVFSSDELIEAVWNGRIVSDASVVSCIASARKAIGDNGTAQRFIKTVRGRGFRFVADTRGEPLSARSKVQSPPLSIDPAAGPALAQTDPSLLIVPFKLLSAAPDTIAGEQYIQSLLSSLEIVLMRIPLLQLSSYSLLLQDPERPPSASEMRSQFNITYLLEGSVQAEQDAVILSVQLSDIDSCSRLWAERLVIKGDFQSSLQQSVTSIVARLEPQLHKAMFDRARSASGEGNSRSLYLEASGMLALKGWHHNTFSTASELLRRSWQSDPGFAHAASYLSLVLGLGCRLQILPAHEKSRHEALEAAEAALQIDGMNSSVLGLAGCALADLGFNDRGLLILKNAVELNPSNAQATCALGGTYLTTRQIDSAISSLRYGMQISPLDSRLSVWGGLLSTALRFRGQKTEAIEEASLACQRDHQSYMARVVLAGAQFSAENLPAAASALDEARRIKPDLNENQICSLLGKRLGRDMLRACEPILR